MTDRIHQSIPRLGLGTAGRRCEDGRRAILDGIDVGFRHIDTAQSYDTEAGVAWAIKESGIDRGEFFITTKVADTNLAKSKFRHSLEQSLKTLHSDQVDLTLIHWPSENEAVPLEDYMTELVRAQDDGLTRLIGVSNFTIDLIQRSNSIIGDGKLATNQVEIHPYLQNRKLCDFCMAEGIIPTAYFPLAKGRMVNDPVLQRMSIEHGATPAQIALAFLRQLNIIAIPASSKRAHLQSNLDSLNIELSTSESRRSRW
ncbi:MAG: aldo/keto reductase, partial [Pseudomonadota bacterium]